jgi:hypothetical protein
MDTNESSTLFRKDSSGIESTSTCDQKDREDPSMVHLKEDVSTIMAATQNDNSVQKLVQPKPETNFDEQQKQIQVYLRIVFFCEFPCCIED